MEERKPILELQQLKYFQTVARLEHMTQAAKELFVAQPSLSRAIARLEEEIGVPLFDRQGRNIYLTSLGRVFLQHIERALAEIERGQYAVADLAGIEKGLVRLSVLYTVGAQLIPELLRAFRQEHPSIQFHLFQNPAQVMLSQLEQGEIDFCISSPSPEQPDMEWIPLLTEEIFLVVPSDHRLAAQGSIDLPTVKEEDFINLKPNSGLREMTDRFCLQAGFKPKSTFEVDDLTIVRGLVAAGLGVAFIPALALRSITGVNVVPLHVTNMHCQRTIGLTQIKKRYLTGAARVFRTFVIAYFARLEQGA